MRHAPAILLLCLLASGPLLAQEANSGIYRWTDSNGVVHFSERPPQNRSTDYSEVDIEQPVRGQDEDLYDVEGQAERMQAYRDEMAQKREDARAREQRAASQRPVVQYIQQPTYGYGYGYWNRPGRPQPPTRPPRPEPYPTHTLVPPNSRR